MASIASFSGLASGIQWQDMIEQIMAAEENRILVPVQNQLKAQESRTQAWNSFSGVVGKLKSAATRLQDGSAFEAVRVSAGNGLTTGRPLFAATASSATAAGNYRVEVMQLAKAEKLSGAIFSSPTAQLGASAAGSFLLNGKKIDVTATDTLNSLRDKINAANTGTGPTRVSATVLSSGTGSNRLVLTSDVSGSRGIELVNLESGGADPVRALGLSGAAEVANRAADGLAQTRRLSSSSASLTSLLGFSPPPTNTSILVGGKQVEIDFTTDSLTSVVQKINAAGGFAELREESYAGSTHHRMVVSGAVSADPAATFGGVAGTVADSERALRALGFVTGDASAVAQVVESTSALEDASTAGAMAGASKLVDLRNSGSATALSDGEALSIRGIRKDGTTVDASFSVTATATVDDLLTAIEGAYGGTVDATVSGGKIRLTDVTGGDSQLALSLSSATGAVGFGGSSRVTAGYSRQVVAGSDAKVRVDGVLFTRSSNTVTDAIAGATLNLQEADAGKPVDLAITRDVDAAANAVQALATEFNAVVKFVEENTAAGKPLAYSGALKGALASIRSTLFEGVVGITGAYNRATLVGVSLTRSGTLEVDSAKLKSLLASNPSDVRTLFGSRGSTDSTDLEYVLAGSQTAAGSYDVEVTTLATRGSFTTSGSIGGGAYSGAHELKLTDSVSGKTATIASLDGKTAAQIAGELNGLFATQKMRLQAAEVGGQLQVEHLDYGTTASFTASGTFDAAQLDFTAGVAVKGTDIQGKIDGVTATGRGRSLTSAPATGEDGSARGLVVDYKGGSTGVVGKVTYQLGVGGMFSQATDAVVRSGDGLVAAQTGSLTRSGETLNKRIGDIQHRLDLRRAALTRQFAAMESAMSRFQSQGTWLSSQIGGLAKWYSNG